MSGVDRPGVTSGPVGGPLGDSGAPTIGSTTSVHATMTGG